MEMKFILPDFFKKNIKSMGLIIRDIAAEEKVESLQETERNRIILISTLGSQIHSHLNCSISYKG